MKVWSGDYSSRCDVLVVGSGAPGLAAALSAIERGASVVVLEKSTFFGGTTAMSGGMLWVPLNLHMEERGVEDNQDDALRYLRALTAGRTSEEVLEALVSCGPDAVAFLEQAGGVRFDSLEDFPDYHSAWPGARPGGRGLEPLPVRADLLGDLLPSLRPLGAAPATTRQLEEWRRRRTPIEVPDGMLTRGQALVAPLLRSLADRGAVLVTEARVTQLLARDDRVAGVRMEDGTVVNCKAGVVLACGGFEWSQELAVGFLSGPVEISCSPPHNVGDGIAMASKIGAKLGNMQEAWWQPQVALPNDETDGVPRGRSVTAERSAPGSIIVNRRGERFTNEAHNYNDVMKAFHSFDPQAYGPANLPAHLIFDQTHLERYGFKGHQAGQQVPAWLMSAPSLEELGRALTIDASGLVATVRRFNEHAKRGIDPDFGRGGTAYERYWGDLSAAAPNLAPLEQAPFYGIRVRSGTIGTKGGIVTGLHGEALDAFGSTIPGLYAAGNTSAHPMGPGYPGPGGTLGPAVTFAIRAGRHCVGTRRGI
jgi:4-oxocyclohexanecarboxylate 2-dehydrogenase